MGYEYNMNSKARATGENSAAKSEAKREAYNPSMHVNGKDTVSFKGATVSGASVAGFTGGIKKAASGAAANISGTLKTAATVAIAGLGLGAAIKSVQSSQPAVTVEPPTTSAAVSSQPAVTAEPSVIPTVQAVPVQISAQPAQNVQSSSQTTEQSAKVPEKTTAGSLSQGTIYANSSVILNGSKSDAVDTTKNLTTEQTTEANAKPAAAAPSTIAFSTAVPVQILAQPAQNVQSAAVHEETTVAKPARNAQPATVQSAAVHEETTVAQTARNTQPAAGQTEKAGFLNFRAKVELPTNNVASEKSDKDVSFEEKKAECENKLLKGRSSRSHVDKIIPLLNEHNIDFAHDMIVCSVLRFNRDDYYISLSELLPACDTKEKSDFFRELKGFGMHPEEIKSILSNFKQNIDSVKKVCAELKSYQESCSDNGKIFSSGISVLLESANQDNEDVILKIIELSKNDENFLNVLNFDNINLAFDMVKDFDNYPQNFVRQVLSEVKPGNISLAPELVKNYKNYSQDLIPRLLKVVDSSNIDVVREKLKNPDFPQDQLIGYAALVSEQFDSAKEVYDSLPLKQSEDPSGVNNIEYLAKEVEAAKEKVLNHLDLYVNGDMLTPNSRREVQMQLNMISGALLVMRSIFDKSTFDAFLRQRLQTVEQYLSLTERSFSPKDFELLKKLNNPNLTNASGKPLSSKQKIKMIDLIMAYKNLGTDTKIIEDAADTGKIDIGALNIEMLKAVLSKGGLSKEELKNATAENLGFDFSQLHFLAVQLNSSDIVNPFDDLLRAAVLGDFREYINDETNDYGRVNAETKEQFMQAGMDYDKWVNPEKSAEVIFNTQTLSVTDIVEEISSAVEELRRHNKFIKTALDKALRENIVNDKFVLRPEETTNAVELNKFIEKFKEITSNTRNRAEQSKTSPDALRRVNAEKTLSLLDRVELQSAKINELQTLKKQKGNMNVKIKMWDRVPQKDIFQGNYSTCCIGMAGGNGHFMPYYLMNTAFNMIEIVENTENPITDENGNITGYAEGNTIGNALCYFVLDSDGKPAFVVDNIEINNSKKPSGETALQLRDKITEYAANVAKSVTGRDDVNIYLSENYNDVPCDDLPKVDSSVKLVGKTNASRIYLDLYGGATDSADLEAFIRLPNKRKLGTVKDFT